MKTYKYEFSHQSNLIQIGNLIDDGHSVHVHLLRLQRRYHRIFRKYAPLSRILKHITKLKQRTKSIGTTYRVKLSKMLRSVLIEVTSVSLTTLKPAKQVKRNARLADRESNRITNISPSLSHRRATK